MVWPRGARTRQPTDGGRLHTRAKHVQPRSNWSCSGPIIPWKRPRNFQRLPRSKASGKRRAPSPGRAYPMGVAPTGGGESAQKVTQRAVLSPILPSTGERLIKLYIFEQSVTPLTRVRTRAHAHPRARPPTKNTRAHATYVARQAGTRRAVPPASSTDTQARQASNKGHYRDDAASCRPRTDRACSEFGSLCSALPACTVRAIQGHADSAPHASCSAVTGHPNRPRPGTAYRPCASPYSAGEPQPVQSTPSSSTFVRGMLFDATTTAPATFTCCSPRLICTADGRAMRRTRARLSTARR